MGFGLDLVLLPAFLGAKSIGHYSIAANLTAVVVYTAGLIGSFVLPAATRFREHAPRTVVQSLHASLVAGLMLAIPLAIGGSLAIRLVYGEAFTDSYPLLLLLLPGAVLFAAAPTLIGGINAENRPFTASIPQLAGAALTIPALIVLLPVGGTTAAAIVSTVVYAVVFALALLIYKWVAGISWSAYLPRYRGIWAESSSTLWSGGVLLEHGRDGTSEGWQCAGALLPRGE